jgi:transcriptional regulatory protein RtcR
MATFSPKGRIDTACVQAEIGRLERLWSSGTADDGLAALLTPEALEALDPFDRVQLAHVVSTCHGSRSLSEAGRTLFAASRTRRSSSNDADRLRKYLARFDLSWAELVQS